ncbi:hypothetical protein ACGFWE_05230 [Streptomyces sp. NPDC048523]|uniref:hypothetical protein n=1 Tax=unclassified Streptomyces TaxID=2593676 RepID=UPI00332A7CA9
MANQDRLRERADMEGMLLVNAGIDTSLPGAGAVALTPERPAAFLAAGADGRSPGPSTRGPSSSWSTGPTVR